jgi:hypothetical protein
MDDDRDIISRFPGALGEVGQTRVSLTVSSYSIFVDARSFSRDDLPAQFRASMLRCPAPKSLVQLLARNKPPHCVSQGTHAFRRNQQAIVLIRDYVRQSPDAGCDDGPPKPEGHRGDPALSGIRIRKYNGTRSAEYLRNFVSEKMTIHQLDPRHLVDLGAILF